MIPAYMYSKKGSYLSKLKCYTEQKNMNIQLSKFINYYGNRIVYQSIFAQVSFQCKCRIADQKWILMNLWETKHILSIVHVHAVNSGRKSYGLLQSKIWSCCCTNFFVHNTMYLTKFKSRLCYSWKLQQQPITRHLHTTTTSKSVSHMHIS